MRFPRRIAAAAALVTALAGSARGDDFRVAIESVQTDSAFVTITFTLNDPLPESDAEGPKSSPPAALAYTVELWRDRSGWFDQLVSSRTYGYRLEYDHWNSAYRVAPPDGAVIESPNRADVVALICRQENVAAARLADLEPGKKYYVAVTARLTPIDINKLAEVEGWLSGEFKTGTRRGGVLGVPKAVVGILADAAGFGDRSTVERSAHYRAIEGAPFITRIED